MFNPVVCMILIQILHHIYLHRFYHTLIWTYLYQFIPLSKALFKFIQLMLQNTAGVFLSFQFLYETNPLFIFILSYVRLYCKDLRNYTYKQLKKITEVV